MMAPVEIKRKVITDRTSVVERHIPCRRDKLPITGISRRADLDVAFQTNQARMNNPSLAEERVTSSQWPMTSSPTFNAGIWDHHHR